MPWKIVVRLASLLLVLSMSSAFAERVDNWNVDGAHGVLQVHGALTESACRLDMATARQTVDLGETGTGRLLNVGDQGTPVAVTLRLYDCLRSGARNRDWRTGNLTWDPVQPAVSVGFIAPADVNSPSLIGVRGASGLALRLTDAAHRDVRLGSRGTPLLLLPGQNELTYYVVPERTGTSLIAGRYQAYIDFWLNYD
ncbi:TPA: fimbrial protein [Serratia fonticola]